MKNLKRVLFMLLLVIAIFPIKTQAYQETTTGTIKVIWGDYEDRMNERPDKFEIELLDLVTDETTKVTVDKKDAKITQKDGQTTIWEVPVTLPMFDHFEVSYQYPKAESEIQGYLYDENASGGRIFETGGEIKLVYFKDINKTIDYIFHFNDDNARDFYRWQSLTSISMKATNSTESYMIQCDRVSQTEDTCTGSEYIHAYYSDENKRPIWDDPIQYEFKMMETDPLITHVIVPDLDNNKVEVFFNYTAKKIDDVDIIINFLNGHEYDLDLELLNQENKVERKLQANKNITVKDLFLNMPSNKEIIYSLKVDEKENYTYDISGNKDEGFIVNVTYHEPKVDNTNTLNRETIENPDTSDNIIYWFILSIISLSGMVITLKKAIK